jgi:hypothetical protein
MKSHIKNPQYVLADGHRILGYVCDVDFQHELGYCNDVIVYPSLEITLKRWVRPQDFSKYEKDTGKKTEEAKGFHKRRRMAK